jgi:hypothetical protein
LAQTGRSRWVRWAYGARHRAAIVRQLWIGAEIRPLIDLAPKARETDGIEDTPDARIAPKCRCFRV